MEQRLSAFFDRFAEDFCQFDGALIASRYHAPYTAVSASGDVVSFFTAQDIAVYFQAVLDDYRGQGICSCRYRDLEWSIVGGASVLVTVTWDLLAKTNESLLSWRESYCLLDKGEHLLVYSTADFA